ncbi:MAG: hypothetical protein ACRD4O_07900, partial [Bryobacteraceae bacterium]
DAVHYFSAVSIRSMKAWAHWERTRDGWQKALPSVFPSYEQWRADVESVNKLANSRGVCQQVLDGMGGVTAQRFTELESTFFELIAFCLWVELAIEGKVSELKVVEQELLLRYQGFKSPDGLLDPKTNVHALNAWVLDHQLTEAREPLMRAALSYQTRNHPRYHALRRYAQHWHDVWQQVPPRSVTPFELWAQMGDQYVDSG